MIFAGVDAGSRAIKVVLLNGESLEVVGCALLDQGVEQNELAQSLFETVLADCAIKREQVARVVATGYGRNLIRFADAAVTEITCHARGVHHVAPEAKTIIEIGGQDSKLIRLNTKGMVQDFVMNDRCAAGTGRFLEMVAGRLGMPLDQLGQAASQSATAAPISSTCVVFAETEIIGLLAAGTCRDDIVAGVQSSIATRVCSMAGRQVSPPVVFTGGVARVPGMARALATALGHAVDVVPQPQMTGALGAALLAVQSR